MQEREKEKVSKLLKVVQLQPLPVNEIFRLQCASASVDTLLHCYLVRLPYFQ